MAKYSLVGQDGNAYSLMGYTARALKREGLKDLVDQMYKEATSGDYNNLICVCDRYISIANETSEDTEEDEYMACMRESLDYTGQWW